MDKDLNELLGKLRIYSRTHPNIIGLWSLYLLQNLIKTKNVIEQCKNMINNINHVNDFNIAQIQAIIMIYNSGFFHRV